MPQELVSCVTQGDAESVAAMLRDNPALVHTETQGGRSPLDVAVGSGSADIVQMLLGAGEQQTPIRVSVQSKQSPLHLTLCCYRCGRQRHTEA